MQIFAIYKQVNYRSSRLMVFLKKGAFRNFAKFTGKHQAYKFNKNETLTQVFSCEFSEIFKNTFLTEHLWATAFSDLLFIFEAVCNLWFNDPAKKPLQKVWGPFLFLDAYSELSLFKKIYEESVLCMVCPLHLKGELALLNEIWLLLVNYYLL